MQHGVCTEIPFSLSLFHEPCCYVSPVFHSDNCYCGQAQQPTMYNRGVAYHLGLQLDEQGLGIGECCAVGCCHVDLVLEYHLGSNGQMRGVSSWQQWSNEGCIILAAMVKRRVYHLGSNGQTMGVSSWQRWSNEGCII